MYVTAQWARRCRRCGDVIKRWQPMFQRRIDNCYHLACWDGMTDEERVRAKYLTVPDEPSEADRDYLFVIE